MEHFREILQALLSYKRCSKNSVKYAQLQLVDTLLLMAIVVFVLAAVLYAYTKADVSIRTYYLRRGIGLEVNENIKQRIANILEGELNRPHIDYVAQAKASSGQLNREVFTSGESSNAVPGYLSHFVFPVAKGQVEFFPFSQIIDDLNQLCVEGQGMTAFRHLLSEQTGYFHPQSTKTFVRKFKAKAFCDGGLAFIRLLRWNGQEFIEGIIVDERVFFSTVAYEFLKGNLFSKFIWLSVFKKARCVGYAASIAGLDKEVYTSVAEGAHECPSGFEPAERLHRFKLGSWMRGYRLHVSFYRSLHTPGVRMAQWLATGLVIALMITIGLVYQAGASQIRIARERQEFISSIAHELKTPLTSIRMHSEMLCDGLLDSAPEERKTSYDYILQESERLSRLINNVLRVARLGSTKHGKQLVERTPLDVVRLACNRVKAAVDAVGYDLVELNDPSENSCQVNVDEDAIIAVFVNLVDNALKFSKGAERQQIDIGYRFFDAQAKRVVFFVRDYGTGVATEDQSKVFDLFYRGLSDSDLKASGTGIGLALVQELAERMYAEVECANLEEGAEFRVIMHCH